MASRSEVRRRIPYAELLIVLALTWAALAAYAFSGRELSLFGVTLEKADLGNLFQQDEPPSDELAAQPAAASRPAVAGAGDAAAPGPSATSSAKAAVDESPQRILIFGDSMVLNLVPRLADYCLENGHELFPVVWYASTTLIWGIQRKLDNLIVHYKPTFVMVVLGASELTVKNIDKRAKHVRSIIDKIGDRKFAFLGPPNWMEDTGINAMLQRVAGKGHFFHSADLTLAREADGRHPTPAGGAKWADAVARWLVTDSDVPISMKPPTRAATPPKASVFPPPYKVPGEDK